MNGCKRGPSNRGALLGHVPLLQERELFPWPDVDVPTSGEVGRLVGGCRGAPWDVAVAPMDWGHADAASTLFTLGYPEPR